MDKKTKNLQAKKQTRLLTGEVISDKMDKTVVVRVARTFKHPEFGKVLKKEKNYKVHDQEDQASRGDVVEFQEGRPLSKTKHMYLVRVVKKSDVGPAVPQKERAL